MKTFSRRDFLNILAISGSILAGNKLVTGLSKINPVTLKEMRYLMGTLVHLTVLASDIEEGQNALNSTFDKMERLIAVFDHRNPSSPLSNLNSTGLLRNSPNELLNVLQHAKRISELSEGAFDITVKPILDKVANKQLPSQDELALVNYRSISIEKDEVRLQIPGSQITLDGIAKGFIVDRGVDVLHELGYEKVIVEAGGDLKVTNSSPFDSGWKIAVAHPRPELMTGYLAQFSLSNRGLATSGDYMNAFNGDKSLHHILNPKLGISSKELASVSVIAKDAMTADGFSTAMMVLGTRKSLELAEDIEGMEAFIVTKEMKIHRSSGFPKQ